ncbi:MAG: Uma2 family endonuclease [Merismopedia sp. SIO2A8]|nr:Uma2 family endonuclease [Symploca sp. SIO2B6]NET47453.1 Uma2 family endonuclease [Merismopedia sp. SIO2A8]
MIQARPKLVTFDEFVAWYPEDSPHHYELHNGVIIEMPLPSGRHSQCAGFIVAELNWEIKRASLPYFIPTQYLLKPNPSESGYIPDVVVLKKDVIGSQQRWENESIITQGAFVPLVVEVVSTNWHDDYALKLDEYELMGIAEYWIVDYQGLGGRRYIGNPKQPTISIYQLVSGEYQLSQFRGVEPIVSPLFPQFNLTAQQIFNAGIS